MMKHKDWKQARDYVLESYPKAVCFKYKKGHVFAVFSDRDLVNAERLSKNPFEGKTAHTKGMAWLEAQEKLRKAKKLKEESTAGKRKKTI